MDSWSGHKCVYRLVLATVLKCLTPSPSCSNAEEGGGLYSLPHVVCQTILHGRNEMVSQYGVNIAPQLRG